jgi:hypothetical protein
MSLLEEFKYYCDFYRIDADEGSEPTYEFSNGNRYWCISSTIADTLYGSKIHRQSNIRIGINNTVPDIYYFNNSRTWLIEPILHRDNGPAIIEGNHAEWWINGVKIRETDDYRINIKAAKNRGNI